MKVGTNLVVQESNDSVYISPELNGRNNLENCWAMWVYNDGSAVIYTKRKDTGAVLGKPIQLEGPKHEHRFEKENSKTFRPCLDCGREFRMLFAGKK